MEPLDIILQRQDEITREFEETLKPALFPPDPISFRDPNWGRCSMHLTVNLDEIDLNVLSRLLPRLREIHGRFLAERTREIEVVRAVKEALPDPSLNLENRPIY